LQRLPSKNCIDCEGEEFVFNELLTERINERYEIKCKNCAKKMYLKDLESHLQKECKKSCPQNCGFVFVFEEKKYLKIT
jgi:acetyl-CoA carboxylase beta subunit